MKAGHKGRKKIAFQGELGANSHIACNEAYPAYEPLPCPTFEDAFGAVRTGRAALAMIPIDNTVAGRVADIHHLMPKSGLHIVGEWFLPVQHQLMAPKGASLKTIKTVESHIHALGQCRNIIRTLGIKAVVAADTAGAAREVAEVGDVTRAALAERVDVAFDRLDGLDARPLRRHQLVLHRQKPLADDMQARFGHQMVDVRHPAGHRIVDRDHGKRSPPGPHRSQRVLEGRTRQRLVGRVGFLTGDMGVGARLALECNFLTSLHDLPS